MSRHGYYKEIGGGVYCDTCNRGGRYNDDDRKPPWEYD